MIDVHEDYLVNDKGERKAVVLTMSDWERILEALEDLEDIRLFDEAAKEPSDPIPFEQAMEELRRGKVG